MMNKYISTVFLFYKAIPFFVTKPLYNSVCQDTNLLEKSCCLPVRYRSLKRNRSLKGLMLLPEKMMFIIIWVYKNVKGKIIENYLIIRSIPTKGLFPDWN
jgi:hypothetical protein